MSVGKSKTQDASSAEQLIAGTKQHFASVASVAFAGATFTPVQIEASLQTLVDLRSAVDAARATTTAKVAAERAQAPSVRTFMSAYVTFVKATFGAQPDVLADFGLKPRKVTTPLTVAQKAEAKAKSQATREARHTMGPKQKKDVKGTVTTIVSSTPSTATAPVATSPAPAPATAAPAAGSAAAPHAS
jgi:hypothetical protein